MRTNSLVAYDLKIKEVFRKEELYDSFKLSFIKTLEKFMGWVSNNSYGIQKFVKKRNALQLELFYCDETYIIDFSNVCIINDDFYVCVATYKQILEFDIDDESPGYSRIGDLLYCDGRNIYEMNEGRILSNAEGVNSGLEGLIVTILYNNFDSFHN